MKKFFLSFSVIVLFAWYVFATMTNNANVVPPPVVIPGNPDVSLNQNLNSPSQTSLDASSLSSSNSNPPPQPSTSTSSPVTSPVVTPTPAPIRRTPTPAPAPTPAPVVVTPPPVVQTPPPAPVSQGQYKNGQYTGIVADAFYGNVQVKAIISGGQISDVQFLSYPSDRSHSVMINQYAMPILTSEAIQTQNANVDIVSGATDTSMAFQQSLGSALDQARN